MENRTSKISKLFGTEGAKTSIAVGLALSMANVSHAKTDLEMAEVLFAKAGIPAHLELVTEAISEEGFEDYRMCLMRDDWTPGESERLDFSAVVDRHFSLEKSHQRAIQTLATSMDSGDLSIAMEFFATDLGRRIVAAEAISKHISEEEFLNQSIEYLESPSWSRQRQKIIGEVYRNTRASRFVSILNGEVTVATRVSSHCEATEASYKELSWELKSVRTDARFVEPLLAQDLVQIIGTVFKDFSDQDMMDYAKFAGSGPGVAFFNGLLEATRRGIAGGLPGVRAERINSYEAARSSAASEQ